MIEEICASTESVFSLFILPYVGYFAPGIHVTKFIDFFEAISHVKQSYYFFALSMPSDDE